MSGDIGLEEMLRLAARITKEHGCEVRLGRKGDFSVRPLSKGREAARRAPMTSTERVRKHRLERKQALEKATVFSSGDKCKIMFKNDRQKVGLATFGEGETKMDQVSSFMHEKCKIMSENVTDNKAACDSADMEIHDLYTNPPTRGLTNPAAAEKAVSFIAAGEAEPSAISAGRLATAPDTGVVEDGWGEDVSRNFEESAMDPWEGVSAEFHGDGQGMPSEVEQGLDSPFRLVGNETETQENVSLTLTPSFPPSPSSPSPPSSSPAQSPGCTPARTQAPRRRARRKHEAKILAETEAIAANGIPLPSKLDTASFRTLWAEWCHHRSTLAVLNPLKLWTATAAKSTLAECLRHGEAISTLAIRSAVANGWQGLVWERALANQRALDLAQRQAREGNSYSGGGGFRGKPQYRAYNAAEITRGLTAEEISVF